MNILKILGIVAGIHVIAFFLMFVNPGCRFNSSAPVPTSGDTLPATGAGSNDSAAPAAAASSDSDSGAAPSVSVSIPNAPVRYSPTRPGTAASEALETTQPSDVTPAVTYTVGRGDSLSRIAMRNHTSVAELMKVNRLRSSSVLRIGQKLLIPGKAPAHMAAAGSEGEEMPVSGATYTVRSGDTLVAIAHRAGTTNAELKRLNHLRSDYVQVGRVLKLPNGSSVAAAPAANHASAGSSPRSSSVRTPKGALTHEVRPGETIGAIARKYHVRAQDLLVANNIADPRKIRVGQTLVIPGGAVSGGSGSTTSSKAAADEGSGVGPSQAAAAGPAATAANADSASNPVPDLDAGLKPQANVPVIKVDDSSGGNSQ